jgi:hypothetical protein
LSFGLKHKFAANRRSIRQPANIMIFSLTSSLVGFNA